MFKKAKTLIAAFVILSFLSGAVPARAMDLITMMTENANNRSAMRSQAA